MHQKSLVDVVQKFAPLIAKIIRQGVTEKLFQTKYPLELAEFILVGMNFLFDYCHFSLEPGGEGCPEPRLGGCYGNVSPGRERQL